jgi:hypothetical protein
MSFIKSLLISCAAVLLLVMAGCQSYDNVIVAEVLQQGINEKIYTACNLWYTNKDDISCLNIQSGTFIPIGTQIIPVEAIADSRGGKLTFKDVKGTTYTINFVAGLRLMSMQDYIEQIFTKKSLNEQLKDVSKQVQTRIKRGEVVPGMNRKEVFLSWGYPASNLTPNLKNNTYIYWTTPTKNIRLVFRGDKVRNVLDINQQ